MASVDRKYENSFSQSSAAGKIVVHDLSSSESEDERCCGGASMKATRDRLNAAVHEISESENESDGIDNAFALRTNSNASSSNNNSILTTLKDKEAESDRTLSLSDDTDEEKTHACITNNRSSITTTTSGSHAIVLLSDSDSHTDEYSISSGDSALEPVEHILGVTSPKPLSAVKESISSSHSVNKIGSTTQYSNLFVEKPARSSIVRRGSTDSTSYELPDLSDGERLDGCDADDVAVVDVPCSITESSTSTDDEDEFLLASHTTTKTRKLKNLDSLPEKVKVIEIKKRQREQEREEKRRNKEEEQAAKKARLDEKRKGQAEKRREKEMNKLLKAAKQQERRTTKPGECIKFMKVVIDPAVLELPGGSTILPLLESQDIKYSIEKQRVPYTVSWQRQQVATALTDGKIETITSEIIETDVLVQIPLQNFVSLVNGLKQNQCGQTTHETLTSFATRTTASLPGKRVTVLVQGVGQYLRDQKNAQKRQFRAAVLGNGAKPAKSKRKQNQEKTSEYVTSLDIEQSIVDLQVQTDCNIRLAETAADMAYMIVTFTKAIAEAPFKKEKYLNSGFSWFAMEDSRNSVKVSESGQGLLKLWQQQIEQFHMVTTDVAQAVVSHYPSPTALLKAYQKCSTPTEAETLLKDILIRRGTGPLARVRRVGPELSRKLYWLLTSSNPDLHLSAT